MTNFWYFSRYESQFRRCICIEYLLSSHAAVFLLLRFVFNWRLARHQLR